MIVGSDRILLVAVDDERDGDLFKPVLGVSGTQAPTPRGGRGLTDFCDLRRPRASWYSGSEQYPTRSTSAAVLADEIEIGFQATVTGFNATALPALASTP